jgi:hypothetical protein
MSYQLMPVITREIIAPNGAARSVVYDLNKARDAVRFVAREKYAFPGGYEMFAILSDGEALCFDCCFSEYSQVADSTLARARDGWQAIGISHTGETEGAIDCAHCGRVILESEAE